MPSIDETIGEIRETTSWDQRVQAIRRIPERHGQQEHQAVYAAVADRRLNLTVRPAPDFVIFEKGGTLKASTLKAIVECKQTNDGGTARDKAARYGRLREEATRLGGVALFAILDGFGWQRLNDALGPVVRDCDGRVFTLKTLPQILDVQPLSGLVGTA